jgi:hypothetical protein
VCDFRLTGAPSGTSICGIKTARVIIPDLVLVGSRLSLRTGCLSTATASVLTELEKLGIKLGEGGISAKRDKEPPDPVMDELFSIALSCSKTEIEKTVLDR